MTFELVYTCAHCGATKAYPTTKDDGLLSLVSYSIKGNSSMSVSAFERDYRPEAPSLPARLEHWCEAYTHFGIMHLVGFRPIPQPEAPAPAARKKK